MPWIPFLKTKSRIHKNIYMVGWGARSKQKFNQLSNEKQKTKKRKLLLSKNEKNILISL